MRSGELRHRIRIEQPTDTRDSGGGYTRVWTLLDVVRANVTPQDEGSESVEADANTSTRRHVVTLRYRTGVTAAMRVVLNNRTLRIISVVDPEERHEKLVLTCVEKVGEVAA
jgi:SPP1 family predicted phage head-tail adaptor